ncbi:RING finger domain-containing protein [Ophiocordyceps camponoti-floridani]|uniref:RING finger domain-containing protein n=1 Tax=Ophiocordyceps camponoti-floridani TaxID=2030778 RepID=A0A8H4VF68_9HYPO|nr:RING finger domain-containing protein [Ophiocordyceps camponoti-floridani]
MSLIEIQNAVLLVSNPVWEGDKTVPSTIVRNISALSSQIGYEDRISTNLTTLATTNAPKLDGTFGGLLFVPQVTAVPDCDAQQYDFLPRNVTRREQLPPSNLNVVAIAPWFSIECTRAYLSSAARGSARALIFYKPNNSSNKPQDVDSPVWSLDDDDDWRKNYHFPIFAIPGLEGQKMVLQLSLYSGSIDQVPHGQEISQLYGPNPSDYVRVWTELTMQNTSNVPAVWAFVLIVIAALLFVIAVVSLAMHFIQRRNRSSLQRRVQSGEVDLEAMGIKRLTVPASHVDRFPLFTYNAEAELANAPRSPSAGPRSVRSLRSIRSKRSSIAGTTDTTATNFQPNCHICLAGFEHCKTVIRELPCGHIFHPACIDEFLTQNSSLCPMCKHCMLPRGYSPKITNGMVRREQAVRRLREHVDFEDSSVDSGELKLREWGKRFFAKSDAPVDPGAATAGDASSASATPAPDAPPQPRPPPSRKAEARRTRPRALRLLPTHHEGVEPKEDETAVGRLSPSSFARERMRQIAESNAPFDDDLDSRRPKWRRALSKAFPGFS